MSTGREKFIQSLNKFRADRMPETAKKWAAFNLGYKRMLVRQAGFDVALAEKSIAEMSERERELLLEANKRIIALAQSAQVFLIGAVTARG